MVRSWSGGAGEGEENCGRAGGGEEEACVCLEGKLPPNLRDETELGFRVYGLQDATRRYGKESADDDVCASLSGKRVPMRLEGLCGETV